MRTFKSLGLASLAALMMWGCTKPEIVREPEHPNVLAAQPSAPHLVKLDAAAVNRFVQAGAPGELYARVRIHTASAERAKRTPVNLALAVDTSGSMEGDAIAQAKKACDAMVDALADGDRLAIVTFDSKTRVLAPSLVLDNRSRAEIHARIAGIEARGTTDLAGGLQAALAEVQAHAAPETINRIVLVGDGEPNDAAPIVPLAQQAAAQQIAITTLGLGIDYDETLMGRIAEAGGGKFHYVSDAGKVAGLFKDEVLRIEHVAGRGATLRLAAGPGVEIREVVGYAMQPAGGRSVAVTIGDLVEGEDREIAVRLAMPSHSAGASIELFDAEIGYQDAVVNGGAVSADGFLSVKASDKKDDIDKGYALEVDRSTARASVSALVLQALAAARAGRLDEAKRLVDHAEAVARDRGKALDDQELLGKAGEMKKLRDSLASLVPVMQPQPVVGQLGPGPFGPGGGPSNVDHSPGLLKPTAMAPAPMPAPPTPEQARFVREVHAAAETDLH